MNYTYIFVQYTYIQSILPVYLQGGAAGFDTGNREKLSSTQAGVARVLLSFSLFPVFLPAAPPCTAAAD